MSIRLAPARSSPLARVAVFVTSLLLITYSTALGHVTLLSSEPAAGASLPASPTRIRLVFSEAIEVGLAHVALIGASGTRIDLRVSGDPRDVHALIAEMDSLPSGAYRVSWHVVSADGHPVSGDFTFTVAGSTPSLTPAAALPQPPPPEEGPSGIFDFSIAQAPLVAAILRGLAIGSLMALAGVLFFLSGSWAPASPARLTHVAMTLAVAAPLLLGAHLLAWLVNVSPAHQADIATFRDTMSATVARMPLAGLGLAALALWALALARRPALACAFALGAVMAGAAIGHPAAIHPALAVPATALHLLAVSVWMGGLLTLVWLPAEDGSAFALQARRVSSIALAAVIVVLASGIVQALLFLRSPSDLLHSSYGAVLLMKAAGLASLVSFGAYHRHQLLPKLTAGTSPAPMQRSVRREVVVMAAVILLGGLLAYIPPRGMP